MDKKRPFGGTESLVKVLKSKKLVAPGDFSFMYTSKEIRKNNDIKGHNLEGFTPTHSHILTKSLKKMGYKPVKHWVMTLNGLQWQHAFPSEVVAKTIASKDKWRDATYKD